MSATVASPESMHDYVLQSELYRSCLPQSTQDPGRKLIWINTVCAMFLSGGILGIAHPPGLILQQFQAEEVVQPVEIVQLKQDLTPPEPANEEMPDDATPPEPVAVQPVVVMPANADVPFAVEIKGPVIISNDKNFAAPPPRVTQRSAPPLNNGPVRISGTGDGTSFFPKPASTDYPRESLIRREQGAGEFLITVGPAGEIADLKLGSSSGSPTLDNAFRRWILKYYRFGPEYFGKQVIAPFEYAIAR